MWGLGVKKCEKVRKTNDCVEPIGLDVGTGCEKVRETNGCVEPIVLDVGTGCEKV